VQQGFEQQQEQERQVWQMKVADRQSQITALEANCEEAQ
jgi:hypothetical protein